MDREQTPIIYLADRKEERRPASGNSSRKAPQATVGDIQTEFSKRAGTAGQQAETAQPTLEETIRDKILGDSSYMGAIYYSRDLGSREVAYMTHRTLASMLSEYMRESERDEDCLELLRGIECEQEHFLTKLALHVEATGVVWEKSERSYLTPQQKAFLPKIGAVLPTEEKVNDLIRRWRAEEAIVRITRRRQLIGDLKKHVRGGRPLGNVDEYLPDPFFETLVNVMEYIAQEKDKVVSIGILPKAIKDIVSSIKTNASAVKKSVISRAIQKACELFGLDARFTSMFCEKVMDELES